MNPCAIVTGASSGIGKATALELHQNGWKVYAGARRTDRMESLAEKGITSLPLDVTKENSMTTFVQKVLDSEGRIDALINNAGYGSYGAIEDVPLEEARQQFELNVFGLARMIQLVLPTLRSRQAGRIINISSIGGTLGEPHGAWYHATKFSVEGLSDSIRMELAQFGIDVVVIQPGAIQTEWSEIARGRLSEISADGAYADMAGKHAAMLERFDSRGSAPEVVSRAVLKACNSRRPKTRYRVGQAAHAMAWLRRLLSNPAWISTIAESRYEPSKPERAFSIDLTPDTVFSEIFERLFDHSTLLYLSEPGR